jgi:hypothetical protein
LEVAAPPQAQGRALGASAAARVTEGVVTCLTASI